IKTPSMKTDSETIPSQPKSSYKIQHLTSYLAGKPISRGKTLTIHNPYNRSEVGSVTVAGKEDAAEAIRLALEGGHQPNRYERFAILDKTRQLLMERKEQFAATICAESGLCMKETRYEVGRAHDVLMFAAMECLKDDGQIFSCDISPTGKQRKIFTVREPLALAVAITPFNHPLNQVAHKIVPAIAAGTPVILKPSEKTPLTAILFTELLYEAGLPPHMLSTLLGPTSEVAEPLIKDPRVEL